MARTSAHRGRPAGGLDAPRSVMVLAATLMLGGLAMLVPATRASATTGSWSTVPSPNQGTSSNYLESVYCTSATSCVAVGHYNNASGLPQSLVEHWNGMSWSIIASPSEGTGGDVLRSVFCASATSCVAAGSYYNARNHQQTLVESWNGTSWSIIASPNPGIVGDVLNSVHCTSATSCVAVGWYYNASNNQQTLVESWNGTSWSIVASPSPQDIGDVLNSVYCTSATSCDAVGWYYNFNNSSGVSQSLIEHWNGTSWSTTPSPNQGTGANSLESVYCTSATSCVAAGSYNNASSVPRTLVETWNGTSWSITPSPNQGTGANSLESVSCTSATSCVAAGSYSRGSLVESWNGASWMVVPSPSPGIVFSYLYSVNCPSATSCIAVGFYSNADNLGQTLVETNGRVVAPGYWLVASDGGIFSFGDAPFYGSMGAKHLNAPIVGMASTPDGRGYWLVASDGGIFSFGDAKFYGSMGAKHLNAPIVGMASTPDGKGYWLVASDGGIFSFGDAKFYGSMGGQHLNAPIVGMAADPATGGYWFVASDGGIFSFNAPFYGSMGAKHLNAGIVGMASTPDGKGYWFVASDGGIFSFNAPFYGSMRAKHLNAGIVGMASTPDGKGYWFVASDGGIFSFGDAPFYGSRGGQHLNAPIVGMAGM